MYEGAPRDAYTRIIRIDQSLIDLTLLFRDASSLAGKTLFYQFFSSLTNQGVKW